MNHRDRFLVVGLHPAIDRTLEIGRFTPGGMIRGRVLMVEAAGKGANLVHSLSNFGHGVAATGFLGRQDEAFFLSSFRQDRVRAEFVSVESTTRENVTIIERDFRRDTHLVAGKLRVGRADVGRLRKIIADEAAEGQWAVFSGSRPEGLRLAGYARLLALCRERGARLCVDASGPMLRAALKARPWIVKPNLDELSELAGRRLSRAGEILEAARALTKRCEHVLVSLGRNGALLVSREGAWRARDGRRVSAVHTVGCGDALLAGFLSACARGRSLPEATRFAVACGSACASSYRACLLSEKEAQRFLPGVCVIKL
ncbi:MAG: 1-phosphofructokinase family hexose kinase [Candidatus Brocadiia bacterium]